jgi:GR25 family glycosyltransferase involved in LPS biosynthesis
MSPKVQLVFTPRHPVNDDQCPIKNVYYINLAHRTDKKQHIENELNKIGIYAQRFDAYNFMSQSTVKTMWDFDISTKLNKSQYGCTMSHFSLLEKARDNHLDYLWILEDDCCFESNFREQLHPILKELLAMKYWHMFFFYCVWPPRIKLTNSISQIYHAWILHSYIVNGQYVDEIIKRIQDLPHQFFPYRLGMDELYEDAFRGKDIRILASHTDLAYQKGWREWSQNDIDYVSKD